MKNRRLLYPLSIMVLLMLALPSFAQKVEGEDKKEKENKEKKKEMPRVPVYLGFSSLQEGPIPHHVFDSLMAQGLKARDTAGLEYEVNGFLLGFAERNLYEDSVGNLMVITDQHSHYCFGDSLDSFLQKNLPSRTKPGDTLYFDNIKLTHPEGFHIYGQPMKFVLTR